MGGEQGENQQSLKRTAAAAYDYLNDPRWVDYWSNVLIPPHMASRSDVIHHFKQKFYQRYIDPELIVEPMNTSTASQSSRTPENPPQSSSPPNSSSSTRQRSSGPSSRTPGGSSAPPASSSSLQWNRHTVQFSVNAWVFFVAILAILPFAPNNLSNRAYRLRSWGLHARLCIPCIHYTGLCKFGFSQWQLPKILSTPFTALTLKYMEEASLWVESNTTTLRILSSQVEIGIGFVLIIFLFSWQRNIIQAFMDYWCTNYKFSFSLIRKSQH